MLIKLKKEKVLPLIMSALAEDVGSGDITTTLLFEKDAVVGADIFVNEECIVAGIDVTKWVLDSLDEKIVFRPLCSDGENVKKGKKIVSIKGSARNILTAERTVLNFLSRLSGIATLTNTFVNKVKGTKAKIFDTRKTMPGLRALEKYAVMAGKGHNHRMGLWDGILIKDNHLNLTEVMGHRPRLDVVRDVITKAVSKGYRNIEIEVNNLKEYEAALDAGADVIMLDNMKIEDIKKAVKLKTSRSSSHGLQVILEVSGSINLENVSKVAKTGVDRISVGSLTHSAPSIDFSLEICK